MNKYILQRWLRNRCTLPLEGHKNNVAFYIKIPLCRKWILRIIVRIATESTETVMSSSVYKTTKQAAIVFFFHRSLIKTYQLNKLCGSYSFSTDCLFSFKRSMRRLRRSILSFVFCISTPSIKHTQSVSILSLLLKQSLESYKLYYYNVWRIQNCIYGYICVIKYVK